MTAKKQWPEDGDTIRIKVDELVSCDLAMLRTIYPKMTARELILESLAMRAERLYIGQGRFDNVSPQIGAALGAARDAMPAEVAKALEEAAR